MGYFPPMKERILHYFRGVHGYEHLQSGLDKFEEEITNKIIDSIVKQLEEEKEVAYADFEKYLNDYKLDFDSEYDDFFNKGMARAIDIANGVRK